MSIIYGVDTTSKVTPELVKEAIIDCFCAAHSEQAEMGEDIVLIRDYCSKIVQKAFVETKGDFDNPTKASIISVLPRLAEFAKSFRDQSVIQKHMGEIQQLIDCLE
jgi:hypothetical protein